MKINGNNEVLSVGGLDELSAVNQELFAQQVHTALNGHKAIELGMTGLSGHRTGLHATAARLWVDAASYLPLRQVLQFSTGRQYVTDYRFFPPTAANQAKLRPVIPAGYHRTTLLPGQGRSK